MWKKVRGGRSLSYRCMPIIYAQGMFLFVVGHALEMIAKRVTPPSSLGYSPDIWFLAQRDRRGDQGTCALPLSQERDMHQGENHPRLYMYTVVKCI